MRGDRHAPKLDGIGLGKRPSALADGCATVALALALVGLFAVVGLSALVALSGAP